MDHLLQDVHLSGIRHIDEIQFKKPNPAKKVGGVLSAGSRISSGIDMVAQPLVAGKAAKHILAIHLPSTGGGPSSQGQETADNAVGIFFPPRRPPESVSSARQGVETARGSHGLRRPVGGCCPFRGCSHSPCTKYEDVGCPAEKHLRPVPQFQRAGAFAGLVPIARLVMERRPSPPVDDRHPADPAGPRSD